MTTLGVKLLHNFARNQATTLAASYEGVTWRIKGAMAGFRMRRMRLSQSTNSLTTVRQAC